MKVNMEEVWEAVKNGELKFSSSGDDLLVFNYTNKTEFSKNWNDLTRNLRGAVLDKEGNWVGRSLPKFFHVNEMPETQREKLLGRECTAFQKIDGSLINLHYVPSADTWQYTSKCSFTSDYVKAAERILPIHKLNDSFLDTSLTFIMELRFNDDPMRRVVDLPEGLYLLTVIDTETGGEATIQVADSYAKTLGLFRPKVKFGTFDQFYEEYHSLEGTEGYVLQFFDGSRVKLKTSWYYLRNRLLDEINTPERAKANLQVTLDNFDGDENLLLEAIPDDYKEEIKGYLHELFLSRETRRLLLDNIFDEIYNDDKAKFAELANRQPTWLRAALFAKYSGKDYSKFLKEY